MRVQFFSPDDERETARYLRTCAAIDAFWQQFSECAEQEPRHWLEDLRAALARVDPDLGLEMRKAEDGTSTMYLVPLSQGYQAEVARLCVARAPRRAPWFFETARPPLELPNALAAVRADWGFDLSDARARVGVSRGHLLEVVVASHLFGGAYDERALAAAEALVAHLAGDAANGDWIGRVSVQSAPRPGPLRILGANDGNNLPLGLHELASAIEAAGRGVLAGLAERPYHTFCERAEWVLFEFGDRERVSDVRPVAWNGNGAGIIDGAETLDGAPQADLLFSTTMCPEALKCFLSGLPFSSRRFSRHGERFCYVKMELAGSSDEERLDLRRTLEDRLNRALVPGRLGCVVGAGLGSDYAYIDLALCDLEAAVELLRRRIGQFTPTADAWLLFCDDEWSDEWVPLGRSPCAPASR